MDRLPPLLQLPGSRGRQLGNRLGLGDGRSLALRRNELGKREYSAGERRGQPRHRPAKQRLGLLHHGSLQVQRHVVDGLHEGEFGIPSEFINDVKPDPSGAGVWFTTDVGVVHFDGASTWTLYNKLNSGLPANVCSPLDFAPDGKLWVGCFDGQTFPYLGGVASFDGATWSDLHDRQLATSTQPDLLARRRRLRKRLGRHGEHGPRRDPGRRESPPTDPADCARRDLR